MTTGRAKTSEPVSAADYLDELVGEDTGKDSKAGRPAKQVPLDQLYALLASGIEEPIDGRTPHYCLTTEQRREYNRQKKAESRARIAAERKQGEFGDDQRTVRMLLSDIAIRILADGGPGRDAVMAGLAEAYAGKPGVPLKIESNARRGRLKPKLLQS